METCHLRRPSVRFWGALFIAFSFISSCGSGSSADKSVDTSAPNVRETKDSVFLDGVISLIDSTTLAFPKQRRYDSYSVGEEKDSSSEWRIPSGLKWIRIPIGKDINGYDVDVKLFPDGDYSDIGYARYRFRSSTEVLEVETGFYWNWQREIGSCWLDDIEYGKTYQLVNGLDNLVQDDSPEIKECMFCFKDIDFDGQKELCFRARGYNREYYLCYKIVEGRIRQMVERPYNNIVYGMCGMTHFDYESKTITIDEQLGAACHDSYTYQRNEVLTDLLNPMILLRGESVTGCYGIIYTTWDENGMHGESEEHFNLNIKYPITASYIEDAENVYHLTSVSYTRDSTTVTLFGALDKDR